MQHKKIALIVIIVLLVLFLPLSIFATTMHFLRTAEGKENEGHEFYLNGKLYFYDEQDNLIGNYICENTDYCDYAVSRNSTTYPLIEPKTKASDKQTLIQDHYALLMDTTTMNLLNAEVILYDVVNGTILERYKEIKNYGVGIENHYYIAKNSEDLWGVLEITNEVKEVIPFSYDYIGLADLKNEAGEIKADSFAVLKENTWYLIDAENNKVSADFTDSIINYNEQYVITSNGTNMNLLNYQGSNRLYGTYTYLDFWEQFVAIVDNNSIFYLYDLENNQEASATHTLTNIEDLSYKVDGKYLRIYFGDELVENVAIQ